MNYKVGVGRGPVNVTAVIASPVTEALYRFPEVDCPIWEDATAGAVAFRAV